MIDEFETATNSQVFLDFLAQLRSLYLKREKNQKAGYMLSFSFSKNKIPGVHEVRIGEKLIYEGVV